MSEVKQLQATLASLRQRLDEEQHQLQKLVTARSNIEHEIRTKVKNKCFLVKYNIVRRTRSSSIKTSACPCERPSRPRHDCLAIHIEHCTLYRGKNIYLYRKTRKYIFLQNIFSSFFIAGILKIGIFRRNAGSNLNSRVNRESRSNRHSSFKFAALCHFFDYAAF